MNRFTPMPRPQGHPAAPAGRGAVLLVNLGTPDAAEKGAVKRYLAEFLSDRRVVEIPPIAWQPILGMLGIDEPQTRDDLTRLVQRFAGMFEV